MVNVLQYQNILFMDADGEIQVYPDAASTPVQRDDGKLQVDHGRKGQMCVCRNPTGNVRIEAGKTN